MTDPSASSQPSEDRGQLSAGDAVTHKGRRAVVLGVSAGGLEALSEILPALPETVPWPIIIVQHRRSGDDDFLTEYLAETSGLRVRIPDDKEPIQDGTVYIAPADYHLLLEQDFTFSLSVDEPVNFSRPSIDVLFESAADVYHSDLIGIILTGASCDGAAGLRRIHECGGLTVVQNPETAQATGMPEAALEACPVARILDLKQIGQFLADISGPISRENE